MKLRIKYLFVSVTIALMPVSSSVAQQTRFEVLVKEFSSVPTFEPVTLGHIIDTDRFQGFTNSDLSQKIFELSLLPAVSRDKTVTLTSEELAKILRDKFSFQDLQRLSIRLPEKISIRAKSGYISSAKISYQIRSSANRICRTCRIRVSDLKIPELDVKEEVLSVQVPAEQIKSGGSFVLPMNVVSSKGTSAYWVTGKIQFFKAIPVATKMIQIGQKIDNADIEVQELEITNAKDSSPSVNELVGQTLNRLVSVGQPIFYSFVKKIPTAQRGELVKVIVGTESLEIATQANIEQDAFVGDLVKVRHPETKKMMTGRLKEKGLVVVE